MKFQMQPRRYRFTAVILLTLFTLFAFTSSAKAQEFVYGTVVPPGETVENDILLNGNELRVDGTVEGDVFAFGRLVTINGTVTGSLFAIGEEVKINGTVEGSVYVISMALQMDETANVGHSVYFLGLSLQMARGSEIRRDLNGLSLSAVLRGSVGRNTNLTIGLIEIARLILNWFNQLNTGKESAGTAVFTAQTAEPLRLLPASMAGGAAEVRLFRSDLQAQVEPSLTVEGVNDWLNRFLQGLVSFLIVGGLAIWLVPQSFTSWADQARTRPLPSFGWGVVAYIVGFVGAFVLALVIFALSASLGFISLWQLALIWLGLALSGLGVAFWTFMLFLVFMSKAIVAFIIGSWIFERLYPDANGRHLWPLLLGLLVFTLVCMIPVLGWAVGFIVTCVGLGAVWQVFRQGRSQDADTPVEPGTGETAVAVDAG